LNAFIGDDLGKIENAKDFEELRLELFNISLQN